MQDKFINEHLQYLNVKALQAKSWVNFLYSLTYKIIANNASSSDYSCFWIRLNGLISEVQKYFLLFCGKDAIDISMDIKNKEYIEIALTISKKIDSLNQKLSTDDKTNITYERNCQTHAFQNDYIPQIEYMNGKLSALKQKKKQAFSDISSLFLKYPIDYFDMDHSMAKYIISKIKPELDDLKKAIDDWIDWAS